MKYQVTLKDIKNIDEINNWAAEKNINFAYNRFVYNTSNEIQYTFYLQSKQDAILFKLTFNGIKTGS